MNLSILLLENKIIKKYWPHFIVCFALVAIVITKFYLSQDKTDWIDTFILALTALIIYWYTYETAAMKREVAKQNLLQTRTIVTLKLKDEKAFLKNEGRGPALNLLVEKFIVRSTVSNSAACNDTDFKFHTAIFVPTDKEVELIMS